MQRFTFLSVREGVIDDNNQEYANMKVLEDGLGESDGFIGIKVGKFKIVDRAVAKRMIEGVRQVGKAPCQIDLDFNVEFKSGEAVVMVVKDFAFPDLKAK